MNMDSHLDVLRCHTVHVDGGTYRVQSAGAHFSYQPPPRAAECMQLMREEEDDEDADDPSIVEEPRGGGFKAAVSADEELFGFIIGKGGACAARCGHVYFFGACDMWTLAVE
jgi:hypothetical protein